MNDSEKVLVKLALSDTNYLVSARLLQSRSPWFFEKISELERDPSVVFTFADAPTFECVLVFMCTGLLRIPSYLDDELEAILKVAMVAYRLKMEDLEWCAVGRLEEYFQINMRTYLPQHAIEYVLSNTQPKSHLREWLADHIAGCLSTGTLCVGALETLFVAAPDFALMIIREMQATAAAVTEALLDTDVSNIERARGEVIAWEDYEADSEGGQQVISDIAEDREMHEDRDSSDEKQDQGESSEGRFDKENDNEMEDDSGVQDGNEADDEESAEES